MTDEERTYRVMDLTTRALSQMHTIQNRLLYAAVSGRVSKDVAQQVRGHCDDIADTFDRINKLEQDQ